MRKCTRTFALNVHGNAKGRGESGGNTKGTARQIPVGLAKPRPIKTKEDDMIGELRAECVGAKMAAQPKLSPILEELQDQEKRLNCLLEAIQHLQERIGYILSPGVPQGEGGDKKAEGPSCELAGVIGRHNERIYLATSVIQDMIDRCNL